MRAPFRLLSLLALGAIAGLGSGCSETAAEQQTRRPNILLISVCSIRADHMSMYGYGRQTTPNLAEFAKRCYVFDAAFAQWPKTAPAFATIVSGKYGHTTGVMRITPKQFLPESHVTLSEILGAAGYETAAFISSPALNRTTNIAQGHKVYEELFRAPNAAFSPAERSLSFIKSAGDKPFFVWAHFNNAHYPYNGGGANKEMFVGDAHYDPSIRVKTYPDKDARLDVDLSNRHFAYDQITRPDLGGVHARAICRERPEEYAYYVARYDAGIFGADLAIGKLLDGLRATGKLDDTLIVVVGDHGESLGEHNYYFEHGRFPYDNNARVVLMVHPPGGVAEKRIAAPVSAFSAGATILELAGLTVPKDWEAASVMPATRGQAQPHVFTEVGFQLDYMLAVRDERHKLIYIPNALDQRMLGGSEWELYDWRADPAEQHDLAATDSAAVERLRKVLFDWSDPWRADAFKKVQLARTGTDRQTGAAMDTLGYGGSEAKGETVPLPPPRKAAASQPAAVP